MVLLTLILITAIWGWTFVVVKEALDQVGPWLFLFWRFTLATLLAAPLFLRARGRFQGDTLRRGLQLGLALFGGYLFQTWGLVYTTAQKSGLITGLFVVLVPPIAWVWGSRPSGKSWLAVGLATAGIVLLAGGNLEGGTWFGDLLTVICAFSFALHVVLLDRYAKGQDPQVLLFLQVGVVAVLSALGTGLVEGFSLPRSGVVWQGVLITAGLATTLAFLIMTWAGKHLGAITMALILSFEPAFAAFFGWILRGEVLNLKQIFGAILVLLGILAQSVLFPLIDRRKLGLDNRA
ncbi:DMT family transporter [Candidatus Bipolaricaulota bacterium]|nr:DMT family transporter [Candidatus Bipolaricaulota bacterium]